MALSGRSASVAARAAASRRAGARPPQARGAPGLIARRGLQRLETARGQA
ncbi:MAG: hypothetical protein ACJA1L_002724 [Paracoccaceae bacterium]|jgi:hypothetical protein